MAASESLGTARRRRHRRAAPCPGRRRERVPACLGGTGAAKVVSGGGGGGRSRRRTALVGMRGARVRGCACVRESPPNTLPLPQRFLPPAAPPRHCLGSPPQPRSPRAAPHPSPAPRAGCSSFSGISLPADTHAHSHTDPKPAPQSVPGLSPTPRPCSRPALPGGSSAPRAAPFHPDHPPPSLLGLAPHAESIKVFTSSRSLFCNRS